MKQQLKREQKQDRKARSQAAPSRPNNRSHAPAAGGGGGGAWADAIAQSPQAAAQRKLASLVDQSPRMVAQREQSMAHSGAAQAQAATQAATQDAPSQPNRTGLPDRLKAGVENLSGMALDDVKVHYNSRKPAQLQALAYAQGSSIHLGPGQERHLPHEAWHVVQQRQGRVKPTMQMKGVAINDARHLEAEADAMGARAMAHGSSGAAQMAAMREPLLENVRPSSQAPVMQGVLTVNGDTFYGLADLKKRKPAFLKQLDGDKTSPEARAKILLWLEDETDHPTPAVKTMTEAINSAQAAADKEKLPPPLSGLSISTTEVGPSSSHHAEGKETKEEKKTESGPRHPGTLSAEALEGEITSQDSKVVKSYINEHAGDLKRALKRLIAQAESSGHPDEILQIHRFIGTTEFGELANNKNTATLCSQLADVVLHQATSAGLFKINTLLALIPGEWGVTDLVDQAWKKKKILDASHGADSSGARPIDEIRLAQTIGELQRSKTALHAIFGLGCRTGLFREPTDFSPLILRVLQGSVRHFKIDSVLALLHFYDECMPTLRTFTEQGRMSGAADAGLRQAVLSAVQGVGHRSREQLKMLLVLINHLNSHPHERCLAYEPDDGEANYDLLTHDTKTDKKKLIEVETIPERERHRAHAFYKEKYQSKLSSINRTEESADAPLYLFIPVETRLPQAQIDLIKADESLLVLNIDEIKPTPSTTLD